MKFFVRLLLFHVDPPVEGEREVPDKVTAASAGLLPGAAGLARLWGQTFLKDELSQGFSQLCLERDELC